MVTNSFGNIEPLLRLAQKGFAIRNSTIARANERAHLHRLFPTSRIQTRMKVAFLRKVLAWPREKEYY